MLGRLEVSLGDWVQREQRELEEVETTLERTAEILQVSVRCESLVTLCSLGSRFDRFVKE